MARNKGGLGERGCLHNFLGVNSKARYNSLEHHHRGFLPGQNLTQDHAIRENVNPFVVVHAEHDLWGLEPLAPHKRHVLGFSGSCGSANSQSEEQEEGMKFNYSHIKKKEKKRSKTSRSQSRRACKCVTPPQSRRSLFSRHGGWFESCAGTRVTWQSEWPFWSSPPSPGYALWDTLADCIPRTKKKKKKRKEEEE